MQALTTNRRLPTQLLNLVFGPRFGQCAKVAEVPKPKITDSEILVRVHSVALNPIDFKNIDLLSPNHSVTGCDYAGEVVEVGKGASSEWKVGDRVAGFVHGGQYPDIGSFAEYLKVDSELAWKIREGLSDSEAATFGIAAVTALLALIHLDIPIDDILAGRAPVTAATEGTPQQQRQILIYSAASNVGLFAIQLAKRAGLHVVATASPRSFDLVKSYGADSVFDYTCPTATDEIKTTYPSLTKALDCFSEGPSSDFCARVLSPTETQKAKVITLLDQGASKKPNIAYHFLMVFTVFRREFQLLAPLGPKFPAGEKNYTSLKTFYEQLGRMSRELKAPPITTLKGGLEAVVTGLGQLRRGEVRGSKIVVDFS
ncbi:chaperonin 10-like protein [Aspergillus crustosus]